jgi:hypothetical protein
VVTSYLHSTRSLVVSYSLCPVLNVVLAVFLAVQAQTMLQASGCKAIQVYGTLHAPGRKLRRHLKRDEGSRIVQLDYWTVCQALAVQVVVLHLECEYSTAWTSFH